MNTVPVGFSTKLTFVVILGAVTAFIVGWAESGHAPTWLAGIAAGLTAVMAVARSWQATSQPKEQPDSFVIDEAPVDPDDVPASEFPGVI